MYNIQLHKLASDMMEYLESRDKNTYKWVLAWRQLLYSIPTQDSFVLFAEKVPKLFKGQKLAIDSIHQITPFMPLPPRRTP